MCIRDRVMGHGFRGIANVISEADTIYALSSAQGKAGIAVIRVSGPACIDVSCYSSQP